MSSLPRFIVCKPPDFTDSVLSNRASAHFTLHGLSLLRYRARRSVFGGVDDRRSLMVSLSSSICLETKAAFSLQISIKSTLLKSVSLPPLLNSPFNPPLKLSSSIIRYHRATSLSSSAHRPYSPRPLRKTTSLRPLFPRNVMLDHSPRGIQTLDLIRDQNLAYQKYLIVFTSLMVWDWLSLLRTEYRHVYRAKRSFSKVCYLLK